MNSTLIRLFLAWIFIVQIGSLPLNAQDGIYKNGNKFTFEAPKANNVPVGHTIESWSIKRQEIEVSLNEKKLNFGNLAYGMAQELHQCFRIISDDDKILRLKEAAKRHALSLFKDARGEISGSTPYYGMTLGESGQITENYLNLGAYMDMLIAQPNEQTGINICWALPSEESEKTVVFSSAGFSSPIYLPNGQKHPDNLLYEVYRGSLPVRERIGFLQNGLPIEKTICKEMFFELRCFLDPEPKLSLNAPDKFYWQVAFIRISKVSDEKICENLPEVACTLPDVSILTSDIALIDSAENNITLKSATPPKAYKPLSPFTYLVPGFGMRHFQSMKENKPKIPIWPIVTGVWLGSGFFAAVSKKQSSIDYVIHKKTFSITENETAYLNANKWHHRSLISAAASLGIWIINDAGLFFKDKKARRTSRELFMNTVPSPAIGYQKNSLYPFVNQPVAGYRIKF